MDIKISQLKTFNSWDSFSFIENGKNKEYTNPNKGRFSKPVLAVNENNELVIHFQNAIERIFHPLIHAILEKLNIKHTTTDTKKVWEALKQKEIIQKNETLPTQENRNQIPQLFANKIRQLVVPQEPKTPPPSPIKEKEKVKEFRNSNQDFQKLVGYFEVYTEEDAKKAKVLIDSLPDLNAYFSNAIDTPLTLALKKEKLDIVKYLLSKKDDNGKLLVDANKVTSDISKSSPLLIAVQKDLPRNYLIALFEAGAKPQTPAEKDRLIKAAGDNQKYVQAIKDVSEGRSYQLKPAESMNLS